MKNRKIAAFAAALCLMGGALPLQTFNLQDIKTACAADDSSTTIKVELEQAGDISEVSVGNTTETPQWYSDDEKIATVKSVGGLKAQITAVSKGTTTVYAVLSSQLLKFEVTVKADADTTSKEVHIGDIKLTNSSSAAQPELNGVDSSKAKWTSSDEKVAKVSSDGIITAVGKGTCTVFVEYNGTKYTIGITSTYDPQTAAEATAAGETPIGEIKLTNSEPKRKIEATLPAGAKITWSSTDETVATVDNDGTVTAVGKGKCRIYAVIAKQRYFAEVVSEYDPAEVVKPSVIGTINLSDESPSQAITLKNVNTDSGVKWSSSDEKVAKVDDKGIVTAVGSGSAVVTAKVGTTEYLININSTYTAKSSEPKEVTITGIGNTTQLSSEGLGDKVEWISMNKKVATVDDKGLVTAVSEGEALIVANSGKVSTSIKVTVKAKELVGDANCDGEVSLTDSLLILQHVANASKHPLSEQGKNNADCFNRGDGITAKDALAIQMLDAKVITALPVTEK